MTNASLKKFKDALHHSLKVTEKKGYFCVKEQEDTSGIKEINFTKGNNDDVVIIQQDIRNCKPICNLFIAENNTKSDTRISSCDFIVLLNKNQNLHIFFCEIKSSIHYWKKAIKQIRSSKIFLEYLYKNYKEHFDSTFELSLENAKNIYIYPSPIPQKQPTHAQTKDILLFKNVEIDHKGNVACIDIYNFFTAR